VSTDDRRVVLIGTGPAGAAAAVTLHRAGIAVTVLEAGRESAPRGLTVRVPGFTVAHLHSSHLSYPPDIREDPHGPPAWFHDFSPGGLTNHWSCAVPRFARQDFHEGDALGEALRWPIGYDDLRTDYPLMERLLRIGGGGEEVPNLPANEVRHRVRLSRDWSGLVAKAAARGHGLTALPKAYGSDFMVTRAATPFNSYLRVIAPLPRSNNFQVVFGARATRLEWSRQAGRVTRVHYSDSHGREQSVPAAVVVVAAGAVASSRLLLESRSEEFPQGLGNQHGILGRYLHDHPLGKLSIEVSRPISIHPPAYLTRAPYGESPPLRGVASILWSGSGARVRSWLRLQPDKADCIGFSLFGSMTPDKSMGIALGHASNGDASKVSLQLGFDEGCLREMDRARDRVLQILEDEGLRPKVREWFVERPGWSVHLGGTSRMHASPEHGVVDGFCRVHGAPNVRVVDSGVFTTGPEKNPSLTAMAIASRACRQLAEELRRG
jgi:choline dehydrogenase-like flavoprotein